MARSAFDGEPARKPILEATDDVCGIPTEEPKRGCCEARRIPLVADDHDSLLVAYRSLLEGALWIQTPLQDVAIDDLRAGNHAVALPLLERSNIDKHGSGSDRVVSLTGC